MKKTFLLLALSACFFTANAQTHKRAGSSKPTQKPATVVNPVQNTDKDLELIIKIKSHDFNELLLSANAGFMPWLRTTATPMNQSDGAQSYFNGILQNVIMQRNDQIKADSIAALKADTVKHK